MAEPELPRGRYLTVAYQVHPEAGGQTRAMLMRTRILAQQGGVRPEVLALGPAPDSEARRTALLEQGALIEAIATRNLYDHYREHGWGDEPPGDELPDLAAHKVDEQPREDGSLLRVVYRPPGGGPKVYDYTRADGTPFLRVAAHAFSSKPSWPKRILRVGPDGRVCGEFGSLGGLHHRWLADLTPDDERVFVFTDSRYVLPHLAPLRDRRMRLLYQVHNLHLQPPARRWDGPMEPAYKRVLKRASDVDAFVTLTARQRDEIGARRGRTTNMHVVPNPVTVPPAPAEPPARDPLRATVLARLSPQKQLLHAVAAWEHVAAEVPGATLDIYGEGPERALVEQAIAERGLGEAVRMRGFDPGARDALWTSSALLLTSVFEGYPLSTLEAMARGCPVVSYDVRYGPREQITDGVDGFVVPDGDVDALAGRVVELLRSPELVARMSAAARATAERHDSADFLRHWADVIAAAEAEGGRRPRVKAVHLELDKLEASGTGRLAQIAGRAAQVEVAGAAVVEQRGKPRGLRDAVLELAWVDVASGEARDVPLEVRRGGGALRFSATAPLPEAPAALRLRLRWRAFAWERELRPAT
ncbi:MAG: glycosyltransferase [Solirubrobacteraceae bacterium]